MSKITSFFKVQSRPDAKSSQESAEVKELSNKVFQKKESPIVAQKRKSNVIDDDEDDNVHVDKMEVEDTKDKENSALDSNNEVGRPFKTPSKGLVKMASVTTAKSNVSNLTSAATPAGTTSTPVPKMQTFASPSVSFATPIPSSLPNAAMKDSSAFKATPMMTPKSVKPVVQESPYVNERRDANRRLPTDPDYDSRTLYVPKEEYKKMTPAQAQYWEIKAKNMDCVLFFKMGKFYELFDCDAEVGVRELELNLMGKQRLHAGFPEAAYDKYAEKLVHLGYKIARVEQTETANNLKDRKSSGLAKSSSVMKRDLCNVLTPGTLTDPTLIGHDSASFLLSICEEQEGYGVCLVDSASAMFRVGYFKDDKSRSKLRTILASMQIEEIVFPRECLSDVTMSILRRDLSASTWERKNPLTNEIEYWNAETTVAELEKFAYFKLKGWPQYLTELRSTCENSSLARLALSAIGGAVWYLRRVMLDVELVSLGNFAQLDACENIDPYLQLDATSLSNLEILQTSDGSFQGSLLQLLDCTQSAFGKREFKKWVVRPLSNPIEINKRLDAVEDFIKNDELTSSLRRQLKKLPDLERLLSRIHALGIGRDKDAVMYSNVSAKNLKIFLSVLDGFESSLALIKEFENSQDEFKSHILRSLQYPKIDIELTAIKNSFDEENVRETWKITPAAGIHEEFDTCQARLKEITDFLENYLVEQQRFFHDKTIKYAHRAKETYQLEIPKNSCKNVPTDYSVLSSTKAVNRYWSNTLRDAVSEMQTLEEKLTEIQGEITRSFFTRFDASYDKWVAAITCLSTLDCLMALATVSSHSDGVMSRPVFTDSSKPVLELKAARHPSVAASSLKPYIPNDTYLGGNHASFVLVTGPNMGGKSTLLRQTCIAVIIAQIGCYVPAESCVLSPVDKIFTRIGAYDHILSGQSTFFVELEETATILKCATKNSLVILDELGRGTSTFDGTAIAYSVAEYISNQLQCRCLFSTHYHILTENFQNNKQISNYHMSYNVNPEKHTVTFLYKFAPGICNHSHGMNVAKMAGLPECVVESAIKQSDEFEILLKSGKHLNKSSLVDKLVRAVQTSDAKEIRLLHKTK